MNNSLPTVAFIGGGNMASAMIGGLIAKGQTPTSIIVSDPSIQTTTRLNTDFGVLTTNNSAEAVQKSAIVILAVKPQVIDLVIKDIADHCDNQGKLFISIAAGVTVAQLVNKLGKNCAVVRLMPNMPAMISYGMSGLFANDNTSPKQKTQAMAVAQSCGDCIEVKQEESINAITAISGSGPAYFLLMMEGMVNAAIELGFTEEEAHRLTCQTALGAAQLAISSDNNLSHLRQQITSPGGTTESALNYFSDAGLVPMVGGAVNAAFVRAQQLGAQ